MKVANIVIEGENIREICDPLYNNRQVYDSWEHHMYSSEDMVVIMREEFYFRIGSTLMSVIILKFIDDDKVEVELVTSGGKQGVLSISWGAENSENRSTVHEIMDICVEKSWNIISVEPEELTKTLAQVKLGKLSKLINPSKNS